MAGPKLRRLERQRLRRGDEELVVLRDPLELAEPIAIDAGYEPVLDALDGSKSVAQVRQSLLLRQLAVVELEDLSEFVAELGELGLLDDDRFRELWEAAHAAFVEEEIREPRRAGLLYPDDPAQLRAWLEPALPRGHGRSGALVEAAEESGPGWGADEAVIALVVAHQPPPRIAAPLRRLLTGLPSPDRYRRVVILATDHAPGLLPHASADKDWATPLGPLACDLELLAKLDQRLPWLLREQTRLRASDPVEWATLVLRALWGDRCPPILPIACGQTRLTTREGAERSRELVTVLREQLGPATAAGEVLWWTAAELSHVGPAFGHAELPSRAQVEAEDRELLAPLLDERGADLFTRGCMERDANRRPSGTAALATLAEILPSRYAASSVELEVIEAPGEAAGWIGCPLLRFSLA